MFERSGLDGPIYGEIGIIPSYRMPASGSYWLHLEMQSAKSLRTQKPAKPAAPIFAARRRLRVRRRHVGRTGAADLHVDHHIENPLGQDGQQLPWGFGSEMSPRNVSWLERVYLSWTKSPAMPSS